MLRFKILSVDSGTNGSILRIDLKLVESSTRNPINPRQNSVLRKNRILFVQFVANCSTLNRTQEPLRLAKIGVKYVGFAFSIGLHGTGKHVTSTFKSVHLIGTVL